MTTFPFAFDDDGSIIRIDDNLSQLGTQAINQLRDAVFAIEQSLGLQPGGSLSSVADRLAVSLNQNGTIKASALTSIGLATLPITDSQVAPNAGIQESKLNLIHTTTNLYTRIVSDENTLNSLAAFATATNSDLHVHIAGGTILSDNSKARHVTSQIDLNAVPFDSRDPSYIWSGLVDKNGAHRSAANLADALLQVNNDLVGHENAVSGAHVATAISVDTSNFNEIPITANNVQKALDALDDLDTLSTGEHRQSMHSNGIPKKARSQLQNLDGYSEAIVPLTPVNTFLAHSGNQPDDSNVEGDDIITFKPTPGNVFETQFSQVKVGDVVRVDYGNGISAIFNVESIRYVPGSEYTIRINGYNLFDSLDGYARIDSKLFDEDTYGVLACSAVNNDVYTNIMGSIIVGSPRGATALGLGFDPDKLNSAHYNLWLALYPTGNPIDKIISLPPIDVTGNQGITPGAYTIDSVVNTTNKALRASGFNYRLIAFSRNDEFGIMLADAIGNAGFSIISGEVSGASVVPGPYTNNVAADDGYDALGFFAAHESSPAYTTSYASALDAANFPTIVIPALRNRNYIVNGMRRDTFANTYKAIGDGYWNANITNRTSISTTTVEVEYTVDMCLDAAELKVGKTILVQPAFGFNDVRYIDSDYGRFIIKSVAYNPACGPLTANTVITVISGIHAAGTPITVSSDNIPVRLYFGQDSVSFNAYNIINALGVGTYIRHHEIYVDGDGNTFSHERARMPHQNGGGGLLNTGSISSSPWMITEVSPKLRGFRNVGSLDFRTYLRFIVVAYDASAGYIDGYVGSPNGVSGVSNFGNVVRIRKNEKGRFYDSTNVDYIELQYTELGTSATSVVVSAPEHVDIEIFPSLEVDEEVMPIGRVNLNNLIVTYVDSNARQFGNVSEKDFSDSAISFIEAADRFLHANGVLRGLDYVGNAGAQFSFNGGMAIVNGHVLSVNADTVQIPEVRSISSAVTWAICLNDKGLLEPIIISSVPGQFFVSNITPHYYLTSVTFPELIATRKDLLPLYIVSVTIASFTLGTVIDARRFVDNETLNIPLSLATDVITGSTATFRSFEQLKTWQRYYLNSVGAVVVNLRGNITVGTESISSSELILQGGAGSIIIISSALTLGFVSIKDTEIILTAGAVLNLGFGSSLENCTIFANSNQSVVITGDDVSITGCSFTYTPVTAPTAGDYIGTGNGAIYCSANSVGVAIENCSFLSSATTRYPFINIEITKGSLLDNTIIRDNKFADVTATAYAAIAIVGITGSGAPPTAIDVRIEDNVCADLQGIYFTATAYTQQPIAINCQIRNNHCGVIGYITQDNTGIGSLPANNSCPGSLLIAGNTTTAIGAVLANTANTVPTGADLSNSTGVVTITNNFTRGMKLPYYCATSQNSMLLVSSNIVEAGSMSLVPPAFQYIDGISVYAGASIRDGYSCTISNNIIRQGSFSPPGTYGFRRGIDVRDCGVNILGNNISGIYNIGIICISDTTAPAIVQNNRIIRGATSISSYITTGTSADVITDNHFDSMTVDNASTATISYTVGATVVRNHNHVVQQAVWPLVGALSLGNSLTPLVIAGAVTGSSFITINEGNDNFGINLMYVDTAAEVHFNWSFELADIIPPGVKILYVDGYYSIGSTGIAPAGGADEVTIAYRDNINSPIISTTPSSWATAHASIAVNIAVTPITGGFITLKGKVKDPSDWDGTFNVIKVTYVW